MRGTTLFSMIALPFFAFAQPTSKQVTKAFDQPVWKVPEEGTLLAYDISTHDDSLLCTTSVMPGLKPFNLTFSYLHRNTGETLYRVNVRAGKFNFFKKNDLYYLSGDTLYKFNDATLTNTAFAIMSGYKLEYMHMLDTVTYITCVSTTNSQSKPLFEVNNRTGHVTKHSFTINGGFFEMHKNVAIWWDSNYIYHGTDTLTGKTLWSVDFKFKQPPQNNKDSVVYNMHFGPLVINDTVYYNNYVLHRFYANTRTTSIKMNLFTGQIISEKPVTINNKEHPAYSYYLTTDSNSNNHKVCYFITHDNGKTLKTWRFNITPYYSRFELKDMDNTIFTTTMPSIVDSGKLYVNFLNIFWCFDEATGKPLWHQNLHSFYGHYQLLNSPNYILLYNWNYRKIAVINKHKHKDVSVKNLKYTAVTTTLDGNSIYLATHDGYLEKIKLPE